MTNQQCTRLEKVWVQRLLGQRAHGDFRECPEWKGEPFAQLRQRHELYSLARYHLQAGQNCDFGGQMTAKA